ncbi:hypothetical protein [Nostoc sphaeroides]|uniref:Uncharacterized protein n=1 Tax=Nostoc sphaeroides CCNUC1 TaxID=2653204 RepID=A0A5P8WH86_9NOSO|nr:hypothetical protein [Nostoc sphaeroides]MCC5633069.1 hypothetical protein [Nostoc sphaeroides CHAB 2801]QFS51526.1 hypothetical protein GXM_09020 [Nostoc sphaeroides CCNUC1]
MNWSNAAQVKAANSQQNKRSFLAEFQHNSVPQKHFASGKLIHSLSVIDLAVVGFDRAIWVINCLCFSWSYQLKSICRMTDHGCVDKSDRISDAGS